MTQPSPLASPSAWNAVAEGYATELLPLFALYSQDALDLSQTPEGGRVLDVAAGPGTLSLLAAKRGARVSAIDFSERMVSVFQRRLAESGLSGVDVQTGDGQDLEFSDSTFDSAFSMFGLMFFPDREAGFRELHRVLKPGGRAVVSSWSPVSEAPLLGAMFSLLGEYMPGLAFGRGPPPPLSDPATFEQEMRAAGFSEVSTHIVRHSVAVPSIRKFWHSQEIASAPLVLLRSNTDESKWREISEKIIAGLEEKFGNEPQEFSWPANLAVGVK